MRRVSIANDDARCLRVRYNRRAALWSTVYEVHTEEYSIEPQGAAQAPTCRRNGSRLAGKGL